MSAIDRPSPPFADAVSGQFVERHYAVITYALTQGARRVPVGREGNFVARDHNQRGQLAPGDDEFTARCIAHSYGVMHYSEMLAFLRSVPDALGPRVAALDIGCGIGSALAATSAAVAGGDHRWMGFDPHPATLGLARAVLDGLLVPPAILIDELDGSAAQRLTSWATDDRRLVLLISHVLGQRSVSDDSLHAIASWIVALVQGAGGAELLAVEPDRSGVVERGPQLLARIGERVDVEAHVDEVRDLVRLETRSTAPIAPFVGPCRKRVRWHTLTARRR